MVTSIDFRRALSLRRRTRCRHRWHLSVTRQKSEKPDHLVVTLHSSGSIYRQYDSCFLKWYSESMILVVTGAQKVENGLPSRQNF